VGQPSLVSAIEPEPIVRVQGFSKFYRKNLAVDGVDLTVNAGEIYGLIGPDGAGKSTLMKAIAGVLTYDGGQVEIFGEVIDSEVAAENIKGRIGFMPQGLGLNLYDELSVEENIDFFAQLRDVPADVLVERKSRLLAMTRLEPFVKRPMKLLSGGMKQKLGLVCTLIHEPSLIILDEPTTGVDPVSRRDFWAILATLLREKGVTALISTSYMDEATRFQRLSLMHESKVLAAGEPETILQQAPGSIVELRVEPQIEALDKLNRHFSQIEAIGPRLKIFVDDLLPADAKEAVTNAISEMTLHDLYAGAPALEDAFVSLLRRRHLVDLKRHPSELYQFIERSTVSNAGSELAIEAKGLTRDFDTFRAVDGVSFQVKKGEIFGLLGANGAGKTTAIRMLTGILKPTEGEGFVAGADMRRAGRVIKERIGYMSQAFSLYLDLTVVENIRLYAGIYGLNAKQTVERTKWVIQMAGLGGFEKSRAASLPMGIRQRLALGCALVHRPKVLFLDEPTSGVDPVGRRLFWDILVRLSRQENIAILVTTHYMSEAEHCDHIVLMYAGRVVENDAPDAMKQALQREKGQLLEVLTDKPLVALAHLEKSEFEGAALFGKRVHLFVQEVDRATAQINALLAQQGVKVIAINKRSATMEDVFVYRVLALESKRGA